MKLFSNFARRFFLRLALGPYTYKLMTQSLLIDNRIKRAHSVDIVIRKDAVEKRVEADWIKTVARIVL